MAAAHGRLLQHASRADTLRFLGQERALRGSRMTDDATGPNLRGQILPGLPLDAMRVPRALR